MKKRLLIPILCLGLSLSSCSFGNQESEDAAPPASWEESLAVAQLARTAAEERAAFYEERFTDLQTEMNALKATFAEERADYEARIEALEAEIQANGNTDIDADGTAPPAETPSDPTSFPFRYSVSDGGALILSYTGTDTAVTIPQKTPEGDSIIAIADRAFENNLKLTSVTIPSGIRQIGWFAFSGCIALSEVTIPESVTSIGYGAFLNCPSTLTVHCPAGSYAEAYARSYGLKT